MRTTRNNSADDHDDVDNDYDDEDIGDNDGKVYDDKVK